MYRSNSWSHEEAIRHLRGAGRSRFDQRGVAALERVLAREHGASLRIAV